MSHIGKNIRKIRTVKKLSQADFASLFNLARPSVGAYEEGRAEPKIETVIQIAAKFKIAIDRLLTKDITINELYHIDKFEKEVVNKQEGAAKRHVAPFVGPEQMAQYISQYNDPEFVKQLPEIHLPNADKNDNRAFLVTSAEMQVHTAGIHPDDIILGQKVNANKLSTVDIYLIISSNHYYFRRFSGKSKGLLVFDADNKDYMPIRLSEEEILEAWQVIGYYSTKMPLPDSVEVRLSALEQQVKELQDKIRE